MAWKRMVLEIGMGTDIRGGDSTKAAVRALKDALWHNSLSIGAAVGPAPARWSRAACASRTPPAPTSP